MLLPVFFLFAHFDKADMGLAALIVLGAVILAIKLHWRLRKHVWFWATIAIVLALHIPLVLIVQWPQGRIPTITHTMPIGIADFLLIMGVLSYAERIFLKGSSSDEENE